MLSASWRQLGGLSFLFYVAAGESIVSHLQQEGIADSVGRLDEENRTAPPTFRMHNSLSTFLDWSDDSNGFCIGKKFKKL
jgi:hypothetical protein